MRLERVCDRRWRTFSLSLDFDGHDSRAMEIEIEMCAEAILLSSFYCDNVVEVVAEGILEEEVVAEGAFEEEEEVVVVTVEVALIGTRLNG